jgi:hypothetical protein
LHPSKVSRKEYLSGCHYRSGQDAATAPGVVSFATIHCVVPKSFASLRTLIP